MGASGDSEIVLVFVVAALGMFLLAVAIILFVFYYQRRMMAAKIRSQEREQEYQRELMQAIIDSQEQERERIARDLHDEVGGMLSTVKLNLSKVDMEIKKGQTESVSTGEAREMIDETIGNVRQISRDLMPPTLEEFGLAQALMELAQRIDETTSIKGSFHGKESATRLNSIAELALYRVVQELVNNSLKHSEADKIDIALHTNDEAVEITYQDNGKGFDMEAVTQESSSKGLGIRNLYNRVDLIDGSLDYQTSPGAGIDVKISVPLTDKSVRPIKTPKP